MAVTRGNTAVSAEASGSGNADVAYDAGSGANRVMIAHGGVTGSGANNDIEYPATTAMTHIDGRAADPSTTLDGTTSPASGSNTLRGYGDAGQAIQGMSFNGASGWSSKAVSAGSGTSPTVTVATTDAAGLVLFGLIVQGSRTLTAVDSATHENTLDSTSASITLFLYTKSGTGGSVSWSPTVSSSATYWIWGLSIDAAADDFPLNNRRRHM